jgi:glycogen operon protein
VLWAEWNGEYRDDVRRFWNRGPGKLDTRAIAYRLMGSPDLYELGGRHTYASINFVTAHDGFTLHDLVSYNTKHNEGNGDNNSDGHDHNISWNCGVEGPSDDPDVLELRQRQMRNLMATLLLSQGVPMLLYGDEFQRSARGNNNTYCQDNPLGWLNWTLDQTHAEFFDFVRFLTNFMRQHPVLRRRHFFQRVPVLDSRIKELTWFHPDSTEITDDEWQARGFRAFGLLLAGHAISEPDERGKRIIDDTILILFNATHAASTFVLPNDPSLWSPPPPEPDRTDNKHGTNTPSNTEVQRQWHLVMDTRSATPKAVPEPFAINTAYTLEPLSLALFCWPK